MCMTVELLEGAALDAAVARQEWRSAEIITDERDQTCCAVVSHFLNRALFLYRPSALWADGCPIIERERISLSFNPENGRWYACTRDGSEGYGDTMLVAAMRAFVASRYDDDLPAQS